MIKDIVRDKAFLSIPSVDADEGDKAVIRDLPDTLHANRERCVGMAANMIGMNKNVIAVEPGPISIVMINPRILKKAVNTEQRKDASPSMARGSA